MQHFYLWQHIVTILGTCPYDHFHFLSSITKNGYISKKKILRYRTVPDGSINLYPNKFSTNCFAQQAGSCTLVVRTDMHALEETTMEEAGAEKVLDIYVDIDLKFSKQAAAAVSKTS